MVRPNPKKKFHVAEPNGRRSQKYRAGERPREGGGRIQLQISLRAWWGGSVVVRAAAREVAIALNQFGVSIAWSIIEQGEQTSEMALGGRAGPYRDSCCGCGQLIGKPVRASTCSHS